MSTDGYLFISNKESTNKGHGTNKLNLVLYPIVQTAVISVLTLRVQHALCKTVL